MPVVHLCKLCVHCSNVDLPLPHNTPHHQGKQCTNIIKFKLVDLLYSIAPHIEVFRDW